MNIHLHIEGILLDGIDLPAHQLPLFQQAVEAELSRLLSAGGLQSGLENGAALREAPADGPLAPAGSPATGEALDPAGFGREVARAVYGGFGR
jgi:hypothetical protein